MNHYKYTTYNSSQIKKTKKKKGKGGLFKKILAGLILILFISGITYALFFCPLIRIREIKIFGINAEIESQMRDKTREFLSKKKLLVFPNDGIVLFNSDKLKADLEELGAIKNISVNWNMPNSLEIKAEERAGILNWCRNDGCAVIDDGGIKISDTLDADLAIVNDNCGEEKFDAQKINFIKDASKSLLQLNLKPSGFFLENCFTLKLAAKVSGFDIYFDLSRSVSDQIEVLQSILTDKTRVISEYIDLQVEGRVYYK